MASTHSSGLEGQDSVDALMVDFDIETDAMAVSFERAQELSASIVQQSVGGAGGLHVVVDVAGEDFGAFESGLRGDVTVEEWARFSTTDDARRYRITLTENGRKQITHPQWTAEGALFLNGRKSRGGWRFRVQFPDETSLQRYVTYCETNGIRFNPRRLSHSSQSGMGEKFGLTPGQKAALISASKRGFFEVPRACTLEELAADRNVTHQALSERMRRGLDSLIESTLL